MAQTPTFQLKPMVAPIRKVVFAALAMLPVASLWVVQPALAAEETQKLSPKDLAAARELDWVPLEELTEEQKKTVPSACCGAYIAPLRTDVDAKVSPQKASMRGTADEYQAQLKSQATISGHVNITQGSRSISADKAIINKDTQQAELTGGIQLREPGMFFRADNAQINTDNGDAQLNNAKFVLYETRVHGSADRIKKFGDNIISLENSEISSCEPGDGAWAIKGSAITIHQDEHYGTAENMRLKLRNVPVLYTPYVRFPVGNERLTGFFFPSLNFPKGKNIDAALPFYWNIAPDYDATITPRYMSERGNIYEAEARHLSKYFETSISGSSLNNDRGGGSNNYVGEEDHTGQDRWFGSFNQLGGKGEAWSSEIHYADFSDKDYQRDINNSSIDANRQAYIHQVASASYRTDHWLMGAKADEYRLLTTTQLPYRELPRINLDGSYQLSSDWLLKLDNEYVNFIKNRYLDAKTSGADINSIIFGERTNTNYKLTWNKSVDWGFFKPGVAVKSLRYNLEGETLTTTNNSPSFVVPQANVDTGLYFERNANFFGSNYLQTLEPRAFYFYSGYRNQDSLYGLTSSAKNNFVNFDTSELTFNYNQLFRTTRFAGGDRLDDANQLSLALSSAIVSPRSGIERLRVSVGQIFYANDRRITVYDSLLPENATLVDANKQTSSDIVTQISSQIGKDLHVTTDIAYDQHVGLVDNASTGLHYVNDTHSLFNIVYRYTRKPVVTSSQLAPLNTDHAFNQIDVSGLLPVNSRWSVVARSNYDFHYGVELDTFAGFEYNDCCYRVRFMYRRWLDVNYGNPNYLDKVTGKDYRAMPMLFIEFKGLGGVDQRLNNLLDKAVAGFADREKNLR